jgi:hypothetical protein
MSIIFKENTIIIRINSIYKLLAPSYELIRRLEWSLEKSSKEKLKLTKINCRCNTHSNVIITGTAKV